MCGAGGNTVGEMSSSLAQIAEMGSSRCQGLAEHDHVGLHAECSSEKNFPVR